MVDGVVQIEENIFSLTAFIHIYLGRVAKSTCSIISSVSSVAASSVVRKSLSDSSPLSSKGGPLILRRSLGPVSPKGGPLGQSLLRLRSRLGLLQSVSSPLSSEGWPLVLRRWLKPVSPKGGPLGRSLLRLRSRPGPPNFSSFEPKRLWRTVEGNRQPNRASLLGKAYYYREFATLPDRTFATD